MANYRRGGQLAHFSVHGRAPFKLSPVDKSIQAQKSQDGIIFKTAW